MPPQEQLYGFIRYSKCNFFDVLVSNWCSTSTMQERRALIQADEKKKSERIWIKFMFVFPYCFWHGPPNSMITNPCSAGRRSPRMLQALEAGASYWGHANDCSRPLAFSQRVFNGLNIGKIAGTLFKAIIELCNTWIGAKSDMTYNHCSQNWERRRLGTSRYVKHHTSGL